MVQQFIESQRLRRLEKGRLVPADGVEQVRPIQIAFVAPAFSAQIFLELQYELSQIVSAAGGIVRPVTYVPDQVAVLGVDDDESFNTLVGEPKP